MAQEQGPKDGAKGTGEPGWTEAEKGQGAAGDAEAKGHPKDDRSRTEAAAARERKD